MENFRCPQCGLVNFATATACKRCKTEFNLGVGGGYTNSYQNQGDVPFSAGRNQSYERQSSNYETSNFASAADSSRYQQNSPFNAAPAANSQKSGLAIASMVIGCAGFFLCWGFFGVGSLTGLILGIIALTKIKKNPAEYGGKGFAIAGIALNSVLLLFIPMIAAIAIPNLLAARRSANEGSAIASMRTLHAAEMTFMATQGKGSCGDLRELAAANLIDPNLADGQKSGYNFTVTKRPSGSCDLNAAPQDSSSGNRSFYVSSKDGEIHAANKNGAPASITDPTLNR